jgi:osmoprotectant transport system ATP-binding protein
MIVLEKAEMRFGDVQALKPTDLTIEEGKTTVLIGPSGCGKSTAIRLIVGLLLPTGGKVTVEGEEVTKATRQDLRRRIGYVIQDGGLFPHLTARNNVLLMGKHLKRDQGELEKRLMELADLTHFPKDGLDRFPGELSGGQRQRVSLMRALMLDPEILLFDEPLGALDPLVRASLQKDLREVFSTLHRTVVIVTHDMAEAAYLADSIVLMRKGEVVQKGSLDDLKNRPADPFVTEFINAQSSVVALDEVERQSGGAK